MTTVGVYDSGVGGLTTLKLLEEKFPYCDFYYLSDNKNMPFGTKSASQIQDILNSALKKLRAHSDIQVLACNTASTLCEDESVLKLLPPAIDDTSKTLLLATPMTIHNLKSSGYPNCKFADTPELAQLVEVYTSIAARKGCLNFRELLPYLATKLFEFKGVNNVVLGCSHYLYLKNEISKILGTVKFVDGNSNIISALQPLVEKEKRHGQVVFDFTEYDDTTKYARLFELLQNEKKL